MIPLGRNLVTSSLETVGMSFSSPSLLPTSFFFFFVVGFSLFYVSFSFSTITCWFSLYKEKAPQHFAFPSISFLPMHTHVKGQECTQTQQSVTDTEVNANKRSYAKC